MLPIPPAVLTKISLWLSTARICLSTASCFFKHIQKNVPFASTFMAAVDIGDDNQERRIFWPIHDNIVNDMLKQLACADILTVIVQMRQQILNNNDIILFMRGFSFGKHIKNIFAAQFCFNMSCFGRYIHQFGRE